jgi:hypothetical protein
METRLSCHGACHAKCARHTATSALRKKPMARGERRPARRRRASTSVGASGRPMHRALIRSAGRQVSRGLFHKRRNHSRARDACARCVRALPRQPAAASRKLLCKCAAGPQQRGRMRTSERSSAQARARTRVRARCTARRPAPVALRACALCPVRAAAARRGSCGLARAGAASERPRAAARTDTARYVQPTPPASPVRPGRRGATVVCNPIGTMAAPRHRCATHSPTYATPDGVCNIG